MENIHASCVSLKNKGILFIGPSGYGKSTCCLRLIADNEAILIADDRVDIRSENNALIASCPKEIEGLLEVYGVGIKKFPYQKEQKIDIVIELVKDSSEIERHPEEAYYIFNEIKIIKFKMIYSDISLVNKLKVILGV